jgi:RNA polymerase subunit RPABC4/transcription elongation factor Spt4
MAKCRDCSGTFGLNGRGGLAEIDSSKSLSLRETADTTKRVSAPPASGGNSRNSRWHRPPWLRSAAFDFVQEMNRGPQERGTALLAEVCMSLHPCKECGQQISSDARVCPHCGKKQGKKPGIGAGLGWGCLVIIGAWVLFSAIGAMVEHHGKSKPSPAEQAAKEKHEIALGRAIIGAKSLRHSMRNPDAFKLDEVLMVADGTACYTYRAQNGFGGMNVGHAVLTPTQQFKTDEMKGFHALWNRGCANKRGRDKTRVVEYGLEH